MTAFQAPKGSKLTVSVHEVTQVALQSSTGNQKRWQDIRKLKEWAER